MARQRDRHLELAPVPVGQHARRPGGAAPHPDPVEQLGALADVGRAGRRPQRVQRPAAPALDGEPDVLQRAQPVEQAGRLERPAEPEPGPGGRR